MCDIQINHVPIMNQAFFYVIHHFCCQCWIGSKVNLKIAFAIFSYIADMLHDLYFPLPCTNLYSQHCFPCVYMEYIYIAATFKNPRNMSNVSLEEKMVSNLRVYDMYTAFAHYFYWHIFHCIVILVFQNHKHSCVHINTSVFREIVVS